MPDLPGGQPPRIVGPITGATPVPASGHGGRREGGGYEPRRRPDGEQPEEPHGGAPEASPALPPVPDPLVQALDRLRATHELRPVDAELVWLLRARRGYAATPPGGHPVVPPPAE